MAGEGAQGGRRNRRWCLALALVGASGVSCSRSRPTPQAELGSSRAAAPSVSAVGGEPADETPSGSERPVALRGGLPCGDEHEPRCLRFESAAAAVGALLELQPHVVAFGEAHARRGAPAVPTATERFEREVLPVLARAGARQMVVELLLPATDCEQAVKAVEQVQKPVVAAQDAQNQDRFVSLGHAAKALGITPFLLEPSCDELRSIQGSQDGVIGMLELIATKTTRLLLKMQRTQSEPTLLLAYGGAMHNDVGADEATKSFTFGDAMVEATKGRYLAVDLIVPEYIAPTPVWQKLPWFEPYARLGPSTSDVTLFRLDEHSFTLIFAHGGPPVAQPTHQ